MVVDAFHPISIASISGEAVINRANESAAGWATMTAQSLLSPNECRYGATSKGIDATAMRRSGC